MKVRYVMPSILTALLVGTGTTEAQTAAGQAASADPAADQASRDGLALEEVIIMHVNR